MKRHCAAMLCLVVMIGWSGCGRGEVTGGNRESTRQPRIVSLSPAITRTLVQLEVGGLIVGRSAYCRSVGKEIPVIGDLTGLHYESLLRVRPTHVFLQPPSSGMDPELLRLGKEHGWIVRSWLLNDVEDVERMLVEIPLALYEGDSDSLVALGRKAAEIQNQLSAAIGPGGDGVWQGSVLIVSDTDPVLAFGRETYLNQLLSAMGARNVVLQAGWPTLSLEDVVRLDPQAMILVRPGAPESASFRELAGPLGRVDVQATRDGRVAVLRHADALLPSSALGEVAAEMRDVMRSFNEQAVR